MSKPSLSFNTVTIENIGAYFGSHSVSFPHGKRNMLMIHGNNTGGKTSFLNALKWCLFHQVSTSRDGIIDPFSLYNVLALRKGSNYPMRVTIEAEYNNQPITIQRRATWRFPKTRPESYRDLDIDFMVTLHGEDGTPKVLNTDESERYIGKIAPAVLGRFFLFDGELLDEYRSLVSLSAASNPELGKAIDGVLGLPVLDKAAQVLRKAIQTADRKSRGFARGKTADQQVAVIEGLQAEHDRLEEEIGETEDKIDQVNKKLSTVEAEMARYSVAAENAYKIDEKKKRTNELEVEIDELLATLSQYGERAWHDLALPALTYHRQELQERNDRLHRESQKTLKLDHLEELRRTLLDRDDCPVCLQDIGSETREIVRKKLDLLEADRDDIKRKSSEFEEVVARRKGVERLINGLSSVKESYRARAERVADCHLEKVRLEDEINELKATDNGIPREVIEKTRQEEIRLTREQGRLAEAKATQTTKRRTLENDIEARQSAMERSVTQNIEAQRVQHVRERLLRMLSVIEEAKGRQAEAMRQKVEEYTSHAYRAMTHEIHHKAVKIAPSTFGMTIIDDNDNPVESPSAGATQILALSLIISLGQIGRKIGPLVMDTPLGRLDPEHRINVLEYLPRHTHQVAMLYHGGEIDPATYKRIERAGLIGKKYNIEKGAGENTSRFVLENDAAMGVN